MVAYFQSVDGYDPLYHNYRYKRDVDLRYEPEVQDDSRSKRTKRSRSSRRSKSDARRRNKYSNLGTDFTGRMENPYLDYYGGGLTRYKHCKLRTLMVNFIDLGWQVGTDCFGRPLQAFRKFD